ncbi:hypothetical protein F5X68DRAFT_1238, partial [Plectosphaerella plurivora]
RETRVSADSEDSGWLLAGADSESLERPRSKTKIILSTSCLTTRQQPKRRPPPCHRRSGIHVKHVADGSSSVLAKDTGCSRCVRLGLSCKYHDRGMPGRPRKWSIVDLEGEHGRRSRQVQRALAQELPHAEAVPFLSANESSSVATSSDSTDAAAGLGDDNGNGGFSILPFLDFDMSGQLDTLPLDYFRSCLTTTTQRGEPQLSPHDSTSTIPSLSSAPAPASTPCDCAKQVFNVLRSLNNDAVSHNTVRTLRQGTDLFETLLTCPRCYDVSTPAHVTLQNVLLIGRLCLKVMAGYQRYLRWLKEYCTGLAEKNMGGDTVYLILGGADAGSLLLDLDTSSSGFHDLVTQGLKRDCERLGILGQQFAERQRRRHSVGHTACPDQDGRCWKETDVVDPDPTDICPQNAAARALIPCFSVVDEVRDKIRQFEEALR